MNIPGAALGASSSAEPVILPLDGGTLRAYLAGLPGRCQVTEAPGTGSVPASPEGREARAGVRIHVFGASGTGTTTLGRLLGERLGIPHFDTDDFFWAASETPYTVVREREQREALLRRALEGSASWVLSGSVCDWGDFAIPMLTLAVFLYVPHEARMRRLRRRELERFGREALSPGGYLHREHLEFMEWAEGYDEGGLGTRSLALHERWMRKLPCKVLRFEGEMKPDEIAEQVLGCLPRDS